MAIKRFGAYFVLLLIFAFVLLTKSSQFLPVASAQSVPDVTGIYTGTSTGGAATVSTSSQVPGGSNLYLATVATKGDSSVTAVSGLGLNWQATPYQCGARGQTGLSLWWAAGSPTQPGIVTATVHANASLRSSVLAVALIPNQSQLIPLVTANTLGVNGGCSGGTDAPVYTVPVPAQNGSGLIISAVSVRSVTHEPSGNQEELLQMYSGSGGDTAGLVLQTQTSNGPAFNLTGTFGGAVDYSIGVITVQTQSSSNAPGDVTGNGRVDYLDLVALVPIFNFDHAAADFNDNGRIDIFDFSKIVTHFGTGSVNPTPTLSPTAAITSPPPPTPTRTPTPTPRPTNTPGPTPTQSPIQASGSWISAAEVRALPIAGQNGCLTGSLCANAWNAIVSTANGSWGTPDLSRYAGLTHSQGIYAGALVAARCANGACTGINDAAMRTKVLNALSAVIGTEQHTLSSPVSGQLLAPPRQFPRYVIAAELMGLTDWGDGYLGANNFVAYMANTRFEYPSGRMTFAENHNNAPSNGNTMTGFARVITDAYLGNTTDLNNAWITFRRYVGDTTVVKAENFEINDAGKTWLFSIADPDGNEKSGSPNTVGINPANTSCHSTGYPAGGAIPADQGRGGNCPSSGDTPGYTQYPWEGLQGIYAQAEVFRRKGFNVNGQNPFQIQNNALKRAVEYQWYLQSQFGGSWYDSDRAAWVKHLANYYYAYKPVNYDASDGGRNIAFTQWTHQ